MYLEKKPGNFDILSFRHHILFDLPGLLKVILKFSSHSLYSQILLKFSEISTFLINRVLWTFGAKKMETKCNLKKDFKENLCIFKLHALFLVDCRYVLGL